ncbi:MerR family transcriptional regulator [Nakamurella flavida]|uniref:MerR family transcriptional regulator n=1 Tax=Nakamurella flavida TaxID=363630 RepID=A0A938YE26_9ACTN|nr:MerR family transcriptional regulator [Nakamurella flavida]MBM9475971.1 MerR family transcriptional regulator [Nakamurella flavida]MBM9478369.1 MerR family transcriptional regulator [Nakamurella flavida]MDP9777740.1 DNA-binding transcriptional MerR regulator [Nakamurella flavida]
MRIGEVAASSGVSVRALRYYEEQGLLVAERSASGQRRYPPEAVDRVRFIQSLYAAGLGSRAVLPILPCLEHGVLTEKMHEQLLTERARVQAQLEELTATRDKLDEVIRLGQANRVGAGPDADRGGCTGSPTPGR